MKLFKIMLEFLNEIKRLILRISVKVVALGLDFIVLILDPVLKIRFLGFSDRIGEMTHRIDRYLRLKALHHNKKKELYIFFTDFIANRQLLVMFKRKLFVVENHFFVKLFMLLRFFAPNCSILLELPWDCTAFQAFSEIPPQITFTAQEIAKAKIELLNMGVGYGDSFVCFHSRDKAYLQHKNTGNFCRDWSYHDYRDGNIYNYLSAAEYLTGLGLFAIRVGAIVESPLKKPSNPRIIDYSTHYRTDFMDIYVIGNCKFFLGNTAGLFHVAQAFNVPVAIANWIPIWNQLLGGRDILIPKKLWSIEKKRFITFREIINSGMDNWYNGNFYIEAGIEIIENTAEEILALAKEMNARLDNTWVSAEEDEELQQLYRDLFPRRHHSYGFPSRIGTEFLRQNRELLK